MSKKKASRKVLLESRIVLIHPEKGQITMSLHELRSLLYEAEEKHRQSLPKD